MSHHQMNEFPAGNIEENGEGMMDIDHINININTAEDHKDSLADGDKTDIASAEEER